MRKFAIPFVVAACIVGTPAWAEGWYVGVGAGRGSLKDTQDLDFSSSTMAGIASTQFDAKDTILTARLGLRFHRNMAVELGYYHLGEYPFEIFAPQGTIPGSAKARSYGLSFVGILPLDPVDLYGRIGYARSEVKSSASRADASAHATMRDNEAFGAIGARWNATPHIGVFAEYQAHDKLEAKGYFLGVDYSF
jgi:hypothetical protein